MLSAAAGDDDAWYAAWRARELARVDADGLCYLDYTGAALPAASLLAADHARLGNGVLGNPHSGHGPSRAASADIAAARVALLGLLHADPAEYEVVLTANASAACRLVGEGWLWGPGTPLVLATDNHNSVNGLREYARRGRSPVHRIPLDRDLRLVEPGRVLSEAAGAGGRGARAGLLAFPAQSNFSGVRHPLALVGQAQAAGYAVLLDAAALLHGGRLDLGRVKPELVVLSHYKIAGHPTGVGALVARRDALERMTRPWFAGGTVEWVSVAGQRHLLRPGAEGFEDGTPAFLALGAVAPGLDLVRRDGGERLSRHLGVLTGLLLERLYELVHPDGAPMVVVHGPADTRDRGATVACNLLTAAGAIVPYDVVETEAAARGLAVRGGCFCNPGCAESAFGWPIDRALGVLDGLGRRFTVPAFAERMRGYAVGAVRLSLGLGSVRRDVDRAVEVLADIAAWYGGRAEGGCRFRVEAARRPG